MSDDPLNGAQGPEWMATAERSNRLAMSIIVWIALRMGRGVARALLYPITLYFYIMNTPARRASAAYLEKVFERPPRFIEGFRHFFTFGSTILDRVFLLNDKFGRFEVKVYGVDLVEALAQEGNGAFLFGAHFGSFEVMRSLGREARGLRVSLVMYEENARRLNAILAAINPELPPGIIPLGKVDSMLKVKEALAGGSFVGILADRSIAGEGTRAVTLLGQEAGLPVGPFRLAAMLRRPVILMLGIYRGGNRYDIHFEHIADMDGVGARERQQALDAAQDAYAARLEYFCRQYPYNWFNFYDFWG